MGLKLKFSTLKKYIYILFAKEIPEIEIEKKNKHHIYPTHTCTHAHGCHLRKKNPTHLWRQQRQNKKKKTPTNNQISVFVNKFMTFFMSHNAIIIRIWWEEVR